MPRLRTPAAIVALLALPTAVQAQHANENAVASADDAFGSSVGLETTGIYTEFDTRGFSPQKAGNARIDGIYYDPIGALTGRLKLGQAIRVGFAAEEYPFHAPTGIVDYKFRPFPAKAGVSLSYNFGNYGGYIRDLDVYVPTSDGRFALTGGLAMANLRNNDGFENKGRGWTLRPIARFGTVEIAPFASQSTFYLNIQHPLVTVGDDYLPQQPPRRVYLGQDWARGKYVNNQYGVTVKAAVTSRLSVRAGLFRGEADRHRNFTEIFSIVDRSGLANHRLIADPKQRLHATSGEVQALYRFGGGGWQHRVIAGFRARDRYTESGGSDPLSFGQVEYGKLDPEPEPGFVFSQVNAGRVRQSAFTIGYIGKLQGVGVVNLGLQKARYRATFRDGRTGKVTTSRDDPWLYNATLGLDISSAISIYGGTQRGLEDSGAAPENAGNRNEQLPATRSTQYEAGVRWKFHGGQLAVNAFQITKPYFTFADDGVAATPDPYVEVGRVRHRGVEASLSGQFGKRLNLLAGVVAMQPRVTGVLESRGRVGERPAGTPSLYARLDANYRTDLLGGVTPTLAVIYTGRRAVGARPLAFAGRRAADGAGVCLGGPGRQAALHHRQDRVQLSRGVAEPVRREELESRRRQYALSRRAAPLPGDRDGGFLSRRNPPRHREDFLTSAACGSRRRGGSAGR